MTEREREREAMFRELRVRAERTLSTAPMDGAHRDTLARTLHELDVYHAELLIQQEDLAASNDALLRARDRYQRLFDKAPIAYIVTTRDGVVVDANRAAFALLARDRERVIGRPFVVCLPTDDAVTFGRVSGLALATREPHHSEFCVRRASGELRRVEVTSVAENRDGVYHILSVLMDVTAQREAEATRRRLEARERENEKLEAVARLAASVAHDVNNILAAVTSLTEFFRTEIPHGTQTAQDVDAILHACHRGGRLMRGLLGIARTSTATRPVEARALLQRVAAQFDGQCPGVTLRVEAPERDTFVRGDDDLLLQALLNLALNSAEAMNGHGVVVVACAVDPSTASVQFRVTDTGHGMSPETRARIFEPLFTTKTSGTAMGLGLTIVQRAVAACNGTLAVESAEGRGCTVRLSFPQLEVPAAERSVPPPHHDTDGIAVLFVDDDETVASATARMLRGARCKVTTYNHGPEALDAVRAGYRFDVAVIDVNMPALNGPDLVRALFELLGPVPVLFVTGSSGSLVPPELLALPYVRLLQKPWHRAELLEAITRVLDARHAQSA